jgi:glycosyltransferase involved in cell wall biosynthesis
MAVACCEAAKIPYHVVNVDAGNIRQADQLLKGKTHDLHNKVLPPYRNNIFCMPAFDTVSRIFMQKGASAFEGYHNIGWWPWELSVFPKAWQPHVFRLTDEIWASSNFLYEMYKKSTNKKVIKLPLPVDIKRIKINNRKYYGLPDRKQIILFIFDCNSSFVRKNPKAILDAFLRAFNKSERDIIMVFKIMNSSKDNRKYLEFMNECMVDDRVRIIEKTMNREDVLGLINLCDIYISLHRSEGFGRTLAEAMLLGKKVVSTNYSGNCDFMFPELTFPVNYHIEKLNAGDYHFIEDDDYAIWAKADIKDAVKQLIKAKNKINDSMFSKSISDKAKSVFSIENISIVFKDSLN